MGSAFKDRDWSSRMHQMGDAAERQFEEHANAQGTKWVRFGFNRPPFAVNKLPRRIRFMPDYLTSEALVECQGMGRDQVLKLKIDKYNALCWWHTVMPVTLWVWDSKRRQTHWLDWSFIMDLIEEGAVTIERFHEGNAYYAIPRYALLQSEAKAA